jgi:hypothetical protein
MCLAHFLYQNKDRLCFIATALQLLLRLCHYMGGQNDYALKRYRQTWFWHKLTGFFTVNKLKISIQAREMASSEISTKKNYVSVNDSTTKLFFPVALRPNAGYGSTFLRFLYRRITVGRTPLDEWSARCRDNSMITQITRNQHLCYRRNSNPNLRGRTVAGITKIAPAY